LFCIICTRPRAYLLLYLFSILNVKISSNACYAIIFFCLYEINRSRASMISSKLFVI
jgi:hypothetical protein